MLPFSMNLLFTKFKQLYIERNGEGNNPTRVAATHAISIWMKRSKTYLRRVTIKAQNNAYEVNVMNDFVIYANSIIKILVMTMTNIVNEDDTNVTFLVESTRTHADVVSRSVSVAGENSSSRATEDLSFSLVSKKLDPMLIFKRKRTSKGRVHKEVKIAENHPDSVICSAQENFLIEETLMLE